MKSSQSMQYVYRHMIRSFSSFGGWAWCARLLFFYMTIYSNLKRAKMLTETTVHTYQQENKVSNWNWWLHKFYRSQHTTHIPVHTIYTHNLVSLAIPAQLVICSMTRPFGVLLVYFPYLPYWLVVCGMESELRNSVWSILVSRYMKGVAYKTTILILELIKLSFASQTLAVPQTKGYHQPLVVNQNSMQNEFFLLLDKSLNLEVGSLLGRYKNQLANDLLFPNFKVQPFFSCYTAAPLL